MVVVVEGRGGGGGDGCGEGWWWWSWLRGEVVVGMGYAEAMRRSDEERMEE